MFDSLDEQIRRDADKVNSKSQRMMMYALYAILGAALFGALIFGVHF